MIEKSIRREITDANTGEMLVTITVKFIFQPAEMAKAFPCGGEVDEHLHTRLTMPCDLSAEELTEIGFAVTKLIEGPTPPSTPERLDALRNRLGISENSLGEEVDKPAAFSSGENG